MARRVTPGRMRGLPPAKYAAGAGKKISPPGAGKKDGISIHFRKKMMPMVLGPQWLEMVQPARAK